MATSDLVGGGVAISQASPIAKLAHGDSQDLRAFELTLKQALDLYQFDAAFGRTPEEEEPCA
jgi:hypothetical protein